MKLKILAIGIALILNVSTFIVSANIDASSDVKTAGVNNNIETKNIRVAVLFEQPVGSFIGTAKYAFYQILEKSWMVGNQSYRFVITPIFDEDILNGQLTVDNYDVLIGADGDVGDGEAIAKGFYRLPKAKKWKENIAQFVKDGGGYCGYCGGTALFTELSKTPTTFLERQYDKSAIGVSCVKSYYKNVAFPLICPFQRLKPEKVGAGLYFFAFPCMDMQINTNHPIFDDFLENTRRIQWIGGPALVLSDNLDRKVDVLARYPADLSENESLMVHVWKYTGGSLGLIRGFFKLINFYKSHGIPMNYILSILGKFYGYATDWKKTDKILDLNFSNKPSNTAEIYPNENEGRIVLDGAHPEYSVSFGGHIEEADDTRNNYLYGLYNWVNVTPPEETPEDEYTYNYCIVRRQVAWAAKVPDNDLPPVYGASQVSDIYPYIQSSNFAIIGNNEKEESVRTVALDLYYRYSDDNVSWGDWTLYGTNVDGSDGWSWDFNAFNAGGLGYYHFYSSRRAIYENDWLIETAPPGPDAIVKIVD